LLNFNNTAYILFASITVVVNIAKDSVFADYGTLLYCNDAKISAEWKPSPN